MTTRGNGEIIRPERAFELWAEMAVALPRDRAIYLIGNGASASMASHFAADVTKNCGIRAVVFTDAALITALGNDHGFENAFALALNRYALPGDLLVAVSSSGNSPNIVRGCQEAAKMKVKTVTVSGKKPDNAIRSIGDINFYVPADSYSLSESAHSMILHHWIDRLEAANKWTQASASSSG
ncbi:MAG: SIS domain-containing protein [Candidatus Adiutrix sp.]|nr:SIS domain-containing protein [Candidatus Adiutrix sp.]